MPPGCGSLPSEEKGAVEVEIDGIWYAWDESDNLFKYVGDGAERDDGYSFVCKLEWDDSDYPAIEQIKKALQRVG